MKELHIGDKLMLIPKTFFNADEDEGKCSHRALEGTVIYINEPHKFFTASFKVAKGQTINESFKFSDIEGEEKETPVKKRAEAVNEQQSPDNAPTEKPRRGGLKQYYTVYREKSEEVVASGTAKECAIALDRSVDAFYSLVFNIRRGRNKKYVIIQEDYEKEDNKG